MATPLSRREVEELYSIAFPESLYTFADFVRALPGDPLEGVGIRLEGPLLLLTYGISESYADPLWTSLFYNDPPEFLTILSGDTDGLHWGYWIDDPKSTAFPIAHYYSRDAFEIYVDASDPFDLLRRRIEDYQISVDDDLDMEGIDQDEWDEVSEQMTGLRALLPSDRPESLTARPEIGEEYQDAYPLEEDRQPTALTIDQMGMVVPADKYRPLKEAGPDAPVPEQAAEAMQLLTDGYPGAALKLGKDLWLTLDQRDTSYRLLDAAYAALDRDLLRRRLSIVRAWREHCDHEAAARALKNPSS